MVITLFKNRVFLFIILACPFFSEGLSWGAEIQINASMDEYNLIEQAPLKGSVTVTHPAPQVIEVASFQLEGKPLQVEHLRDVKMSSQSLLTLSIYQFELPPKPKGLHLLPEISVTVEGKRYHTVPSTFEVTGSTGFSNAPVPPSSQREEARSPPSAPSSVLSEEPFLKLEAFVEGITPIYPHQRLRLVYHYLFNGDIELTKETLPLLNAEGFRKVGDVQITDDVLNGHNVHEVAQTVEALQPGTYSFATSVIEGVTYTEREKGKKIYSSQKLHSETPPLEISVVAFPEEGKPASFNGAIGQYILNVKMKSPPRMTVGDKLELVIDLTGHPQDIENVPLPDLCCQPGFSGLFQLSDLPPASKVNGPTKQFNVELRPLSTQIKEVPPIQFSSFDVTTRKYLTLNSEPIPLTVVSTNGENRVIETPLANSTKQTTSPLAAPQPIEIKKLFALSSSDLQNLLMASWWTLFFIPLGLFLLYFQWYIKKEGFLATEQKVKVLSGQEMFDQALKAAPGSSIFYDSLNKAFLLRLKERGDILSVPIEAQSLSHEGLVGQVRGLLLRLEENRFSLKGEGHPQLLNEARELFKKLG